MRTGNVVITGTAGRARLQRVAADVPRAVSAVRDLWGSRVLRGTVRIVVPADLAQFRRAGGSSADGVAATTTSSGTVVLSPRIFTDLTTAGLVVVLSHELTHVALDQHGTGKTPLWVSEGAAELTAFRATSLSLARAAPTLAARVRAGAEAAAPPADALFRSDATLAYQSAYAWCAFLLQRYGADRFTAFVRAADDAASVPGTSSAFQQEFGTSTSAQRRQYDQYLRTAFSVSESSSGAGAADR